MKTLLIDQDKVVYEITEPVVLQQGSVVQWKVFDSKKVLTFIVGANEKTVVAGRQASEKMWRAPKVLERQYKVQRLD